MPRSWPKPCCTIRSASMATPSSAWSCSTNGWKQMRTEIIAEIGQNHNGDMALAKKLIHEAKRAGADVAKFQLYEARALFPKEGNEWFDYNCKTELNRDQIKMLAEECDKAGIEFMASVFDIERIQWLEDVGMKRYKIASRSIFETNLINAVAVTGKPML